MKIQFQKCNIKFKNTYLEANPILIPFETKFNSLKSSILNIKKTILRLYLKGIRLELFQTSRTEKYITNYHMFFIFFKCSKKQSCQKIMGTLNDS